jgi:hypothetical protein
MSAQDEIARLSAELVAAWRRVDAERGYRAAAEEIARRAREMVDGLLDEIDKTRRELCEMKASQERIRAADGANHDPRHLTAAGYAADRGWDCFEEEEACDD